MSEQLGVSYEFFEGQTYRCTRQPLSSSEVIKQLKSTAQQGYQKQPAIDEIDGLPVTLATSEANCLAGVSIKGFSLRTWAKEHNGLLVPTFQKEGRETMERTLAWTPPGTMKLFMIVKAKSDLVNKQWMLVESYLIAKAASAVPAGFFRLPLPNIYPDGRVCLGNDFKGHSPTLLGVLKAAIRRLNESSWNTDMLPDMDESWKLLRFNSTTLAAETPEGNWWDACTRISRLEYDSLYS